MSTQSHPATPPTTSPPITQGRLQNMLVLLQTPTAWRDDTALAEHLVAAGPDAIDGLVRVITDAEAACAAQQVAVAALGRIAAQHHAADVAAFVVAVARWHTRRDVRWAAETTARAFGLYPAPLSPHR